MCVKILGTLLQVLTFCIMGLYDINPLGVGSWQCISEMLAAWITQSTKLHTFKSLELVSDINTLKNRWDDKV